MGSILPETMRAVVFKGPLEVEVVDKPVPRIHAPTDAILKISATALCGSDLVRDPERGPFVKYQKLGLQPTLCSFASF
jgi:threonine dehydrogenase-like Zn-dependent dehydrogenase